MKKLALAALAGALAFPMAAAAQDEEGGPWGVSGELTLTSDYVWRGVSQTDENPTLQAGIDVAHESGFYAGAWGSGVDFDDPDDGIDLELNLYLGWSWDLSDNVNLDLSATRYIYPGSNDGYDIDYNEYAARLTFAETYYFGVAYANDMVNSDVRSMYYSVGGDWEIGDSGWGVSAAVGMFDFNQGIGSYTDFMLGVNRSFGPATLALTYTGTSGFDESVQDFLGPKDWAGSRVQFSVSLGF
jgi:uncharacterized protein (TIGR02001 family)